MASTKLHDWVATVHGPLCKACGLLAGQGGERCSAPPSPAEAENVALKRRVAELEAKVASRKRP